MLHMGFGILGIWGLMVLRVDEGWVRGSVRTAKCKDGLL